MGILRISVFVHDPDFFLVYAPDDVAVVEIPDMEPPFTKKSVTKSFQAAGLDVRVDEKVIGRALREIVQVQRDAERAERGQKVRLEQAAYAAELRGSVHPVLREKGEVLARKQAVDEALREVKLELVVARSESSAGRYMDRAQYQALCRREGQLKQDSQACQVRLSQLRSGARMVESSPTPAVGRVDRQTYNANLLTSVGRILDELLGREESEKVFREAKARIQGPVQEP
jgi:hypothetical protein